MASIFNGCAFKNEHVYSFVYNGIIDSMAPTKIQIYSGYIKLYNSMSLECSDATVLHDYTQVVTKSIRLVLRIKLPLTTGLYYLHQQRPHQIAQLRQKCTCFWVVTCNLGFARSCSRDKLSLSWQMNGYQFDFGLDTSLRAHDVPTLRDTLHFLQIRI